MTLESSRVAATVLVRDGGRWGTEPSFGPEALLQVPQAGIDASPLADVGDGVVFGPDEAG